MFWSAIVIFISILSATTGSSPPSTASLNSQPSANVQQKDVKKDSATSGSNVHHQFMMPPNQPQQPPPLAYPPTMGQYSHQVPQYVMQGSPGQIVDNSVADMKSDISLLRDSVMQLSSLVKQNSNPEPRTASYSNAYGNPPQTYSGSGAVNHGYNSGDQNYEAPPIQIEVIQTKKGYETPKEPYKEEKKEEPKSKLTGLLPSLSTNLRANFVTSAERLFAIIKRGIKNALVTGVIVAIVRLLPLLWIGVRLIFNAILPLVGISLEGNTAFTRAFSLTSGSTATASASATADATVAAPREIRSLFTPFLLDEDLDRLEDNFGLFRGRMF